MLWETGPAQRREFFYTRLLGTVNAAKEIRLSASVPSFAGG
jgi:ATP-binding cassette subfamily B protein